MEEIVKAPQVESYNGGYTHENECEGSIALAVIQGATEATEAALGRSIPRNRPPFVTRKGVGVKDGIKSNPAAPTKNEEREGRIAGARPTAKNTR